MCSYLFFLITFLPNSGRLQEETKTKIIFVCEHGGARSTIASVYFNKLANTIHLPYQSIFRGLTPATTITKETKKGLMADGFETESLSPIALSPKDISPNTLLISLDCDAPSSFQPFHTWKGIPAISEDYNVSRNTIVNLLKDLINELKNKEATKNK
jgi:protein-tyrosine-phosphatase